MASETSPEVLYAAGLFLAVKNEDSDGFLIAELKEDVPEDESKDTVEVTFYNETENDQYEKDEEGQISVDSILSVVHLIYGKQGTYKLPLREKTVVTRLLQAERSILETSKVAGSEAGTDEGSEGGSNEDEDEGEKKKGKGGKAKAKKSPARAKATPKKKSKKSDEENEGEEEETAAKPAKKRVRKAKSPEGDSKDGEDEPKKRKRSPSSSGTKRGKAKERDDIQLIEKDPTFHGCSHDLSVGCCSICASKEVIRAVLTKDNDLLKKAMKEEKGLSSLFVRRGADVELTAAHFAIMTNNVDALKELVKEVKERKFRAAFPTPDLAFQDTGNVSMQTFGFRVKKVNASRGGKEGNDAFRETYLADEAMQIKALVSFAMECETVEPATMDYLIHHWPNFADTCHSNIHLAVHSGNATVAHSLMSKLTGWGFSALHKLPLSSSITQAALSKANPSLLIKPPERSAGILPVHCAAICPDASVITAFLSLCPEHLELSDQEGWKPVHYAAACKGTGPLEYLLSKGVSATDYVNDPIKMTPLMIAAKYGRAENIKVLIEAFSDNKKLIDAKDTQKLTALYYAARAGKAAAVRALLEAKANITAGDLNTRCPIHIAAAYGHLDCIKVFLEFSPRGIDKSDRRKRTALMHAAKNGQLEVVSYLAKRGADVQAVDSSKNTALHYACAFGCFETAKYLIAAGADPNAETEWKMTPLTLAKAKHHKEIFHYLIRHPQVSVDTCDEEGRTLLAQFARDLPKDPAFYGSLIELLVNEKKADVNKADRQGLAPLHHLASVLQNVSVQQMTRRIHVQIDEKEEDKKKKSKKEKEDEEEEPIISVQGQEFIKQREAILKYTNFLLEKGADLNAKTQDGRTPLFVASQSMNMSLVHLLANRDGAELDTKSYNKTVLHTLLHNTSSLSMVLRVHALTDAERDEEQKLVVIDPTAFLADKTRKAVDEAKKAETPAETSEKSEESHMEVEAEEPAKKGRVVGGKKGVSTRKGKKADQPSGGSLDNQKAEKEAKLTHADLQGLIAERRKAMEDSSNARFDSFLDFLLEKFAAVINEQDAQKQTVFSMAVRASDEKLIRKLLAIPSVDRTFRESDGKVSNPVLLAFRAKNVQLIRLYMDSGFDVNTKDAQGETPFSIAVRSLDLPLMRLCLERGDVFDCSFKPRNSSEKEVLVYLIQRLKVDPYLAFDLAKKLNKSEQAADSKPALDVASIVDELGESNKEVVSILELLLSKSSDFVPLLCRTDAQNKNILHHLFSKAHQLNAHSILESLVAIAPEKVNEMLAGVDVTGCTPALCSAFHMLHNAHEVKPSSSLRLLRFLTLLARSHPDTISAIIADPVQRPPSPPANKGKAANVAKAVAAVPKAAEDDSEEKLVVAKKAKAAKAAPKKRVKDDEEMDSEGEGSEEGSGGGSDMGSEDGGSENEMDAEHEGASDEDLHSALSSPEHAKDLSGLGDDSMMTAMENEEEEEESAAGVFGFGGEDNGSENGSNDDMDASGMGGLGFSAMLGGMSGGSFSMMTTTTSSFGMMTSSFGAPTHAFSSFGATSSMSMSFGSRPVTGRSPTRGARAVVDDSSRGVSVDFDKLKGSSLLLLLILLEIDVTEHKELAAALLASEEVINSCNSDDMCPVISAFEVGTVGTLHALLDNENTDTAVKNKDSWGLLHLAILHGGEEAFKVAEKLVNKRSADVNEYAGPANAERTPLQLAVASESPEDFAPLLLAKGADVNSHGCAEDKMTPLHLAVAKKSIETVKLLFAHKADANVKDKDQRTPLHVCVEKDCKKEMYDVLFANGAQVDEKDKDGKSPMLYAIALGRKLNTYKFLLEYKADVNATDDSGSSPFLAAISNNSNANLVELLLANGADVKAADKEGHNALSLCFLNGRDPKKFELLLAKGVDPNVVDSKGRTLLHIAALSKNSQDVSFDVENALLRFSADVNKRDADGRTALHYYLVSPGTNHLYGAKGASSESRAAMPVTGRRRRPSAAAVPKEEAHAAVAMEPIESVATICSAASVDLNLADNYGRTPLHYAAQRGAVASCLYLVQKGANLNVTDKDQNSPLSLAMWFGHRDLAAILINMGADVCGVVNVFECKRPEDPSKPRAWGAPVEPVKSDEEENWVVKHVEKKSMFQTASEKGWTGVQQLILAKGFSMRTSLVDCIHTGNFQLLINLIQKERDLKKVEDSKSGDDEKYKGWKLFLVLAACPNLPLEYVPSVPKMLFDRGLRFDGTNESNQNVLHIAAAKHRTGLVTFILENAEPSALAKLIEAKDKSGLTPLQTALANAGGQEVLQTVTALQAKGAKLHDSLSLCIRSQSSNSHLLQLVQFLLGKGCSPSAKSSEPFAPLATLLVEHVRQLHKKPEAGPASSSYARAPTGISNLAAILESLVAGGANATTDFDPCSVLGDAFRGSVSPLTFVVQHLKASSDLHKMVQSLCSRGADANSKPSPLIHVLKAHRAQALLSALISTVQPQIPYQQSEAIKQKARQANRPQPTTFEIISEVHAKDAELMGEISSLVADGADPTTTSASFAAFTTVVTIKLSETKTIQRSGLCEIVRILCEVGKASAKTMTDSNALEHVLQEYGHSTEAVEIVGYLLKAGASASNKLKGPKLTPVQLVLRDRLADIADKSKPAQPPKGPFWAAYRTKLPRSPNYTSMLNALVNAGADANTRDSTGTPLVGIALILNDGRTLLETLGTKRADLNAAYNVPSLGKHETTPLIHAIRGKRANCVKALLAYGADVMRPDGHGTPPLIAAVQSDNDMIVFTVLSYVPDSKALEVKDKHDRSAIDYAVKTPARKNLLDLIMLRCPPARSLLVPAPGTEKSKKIMVSPLVLAIRTNDANAVQSLLKCGIEENVKFKIEHMEEIKPDLAKELAALRTRWTTLTERLKNPYMTPEQSKTLNAQFREAEKAYHLGLVRALMQRKPELVRERALEMLNLPDAQGRSLVHHLVCPFLSLTEPPKADSRPYPASYENVSLLKQLVESGAKFDAKDSAGLRPVDYAAAQESGVLKKALIELGAKPPRGDAPAAPSEDMDEDWQDVNVEADAQAFLKLKMEEAVAVAPEVDQVCELKGTVDVLCSDGVYYDVTLTKVDIAYGRFGLQNFYRMQVLHDKFKDLYILWNRWGRVGEDGAFQRTPMGNRDEAIKEFQTIFKKKTGNDFTNLAGFEKKPGKYFLVRTERRTRKDFLLPFELDKCPPSKLPKPVQEAMREITNVTLLRQQMKETGLQLNGLPLGHLSREILQKARGLLIELLDVVKELDKVNTQLDSVMVSGGFGSSAAAPAVSGGDGDDDMPEDSAEKEAAPAPSGPPTAQSLRARKQELSDKIIENSNRFYELIPMDEFMYKVPPALDSEAVIKQRIPMLATLDDLEVASKILLAAHHRSSEMSPLDYVFRALGIRLKALTPAEDAGEIEVLKTYFKSGLQSMGGVRIRRFFRLERKGERERFEPNRDMPNQKLLWHGSSTFNFIGILGQGLRIAPPEAPVAGYMFGKGVYFADMFAKSYGYCRAFGDKHAYMLLCQVALGKMNELFDSDYMEKPPAGFQSTKGIGSTSPSPSGSIMVPGGVEVPAGAPEAQKSDIASRTCLSYNEFIVYDISQVKMRYLVEVASDGTEDFD